MGSPLRRLLVAVVAIASGGGLGCSSCGLVASLPVDDGGAEDSGAATPDAPQPTADAPEGLPEASPRDAGVDAPDAGERTDASIDANQEACPGAYPRGSECATGQLNVTCTYPSGTCTCTSCGGGCMPTTCAQAGANCGPIGDGCGGVLECGTCPPPSMCGGGGTPSVCSPAVLPDGCAAKSCAQLGESCGVHDDGCGGTVNCGSCGWICAPPLPAGCPPNRPNPAGTDPCTNEGATCEYPDCCEPFTCRAGRWTPPICG